MTDVPHLGAATNAGKPPPAEQKRRDQPPEPALPQLTVAPRPAAAPRRTPNAALALVALVAWLAACAAYLAIGIGREALAALSPAGVGALVAGISGPAILIWLMLGPARSHPESDERYEALRCAVEQLAALNDPQRQAASAALLANRGASASVRLREGAEALASAGEALADRLAPLRGALDETTGRLDHAARRAIEAVAAFDPTLTRLAAAAAETQDAADHWDRIAAAIDPGLGETDRVIGAAVALAERLSEATAALDERLKTLAEAGEATVARTREIAAAVAESAQGLAGLAERAEPITAQLVRGQQDLTAAAETAAERLDAAGAQVGRGGVRLIEIASESEARLADLTDTLAERAAAVAAAGERLAELASTKDALETVCTDLAERISAATSRLEAVRSGMHEQSEGLAATLVAAGTDGADRLTQAAGQLRERLDGIATVTGQAERRIEEAGSSLTRQSERLVESASQAATIMQEAAAVFLSQTTALAKASREAHEQATKVRDSEFHARRDAFLNAAKFILESLNSLSVDVARLLETEIPAQTWKSFHRGDTGIFTRRLASMRSQIPAERLRTRYDEDSEFRGYVDRYIRQFEELFDQAVAHDHGDMLSSTFMTSDVGKLYLMLCAALGRERPRHAGV